MRVVYRYMGGKMDLILAAGDFDALLPGQTPLGEKPAECIYRPDDAERT
jgi:hypothetical protein